MVRELFEQLHTRGVVYCHWKSNEHLDEAVRGKTDLDVLVHRDAVSPLAQALDTAGFKRIAAAPARAYPGVEDYIALDPGTGHLAHLHLHYRVVLGEKNLKGYSLPWEELVLSARRLDPATGIFVCDPNIELVLLMVRAVLKVRHRDYLTRPLNGPGLSGSTLDEFLWLVARAEPGRLRTVAGDLVGPAAAELLLRMTAGLPSVSDLGAFAKAARPVLRTHRTYGPIEAILRRWGREWQGRWGTYRNRVLRRPLPVKHTLPRGGLVVAFLGADGSGKSTIAKEIVTWLSWKIDVRSIYFGSGDGPTSLLRRPLKAVLALRAKGRRRAAPDLAAGNSPAPAGPLRSMWNAWWTLAVAREKLGRMAEARRARNLGMVVICDRFPQCQFPGFNDGPRLGDWLHHQSALLRAAAAWELAAYRSAERSPPDLVVKLHVKPEVAARRKDDMTHQDLSRRVGAVRDLRFPPEIRVVDVDATQSLEPVILDVKRAIWEAL